jgi:plasmid segregation protein ParM
VRIRVIDFKLAHFGPLCEIDAGSWPGTDHRRRKEWRMSEEPIVRAIDLGYGNVKFTKRAEDGRIELHEFPALAVPALSHHFDHAGMPLARTNTLVVEVGGRLFHVGPDSPVLLQGTAERELDTAYARSDRYAALMKGTLAFIDETVIDYLILGLPVSTYARERERLIEAWAGRHEVPNGTARDSRLVHVKHVMVVAQPVGAYMAALAEGNLSKARGNALVVDPGYYTIDWVVITSNLAIVASRCGALHGGVWALLRALASSLEQRLHAPIQNLTPLEAALRRSGPVHLYGEQFALEPHLGTVKDRIDGFVGDLVSRLGDHSDIPQIVVTGGGATLFHPQLQAKFPAHRIAMLNEPQFANLRGFQAIGEKLARLAEPGAQDA